MVVVVGMHRVGVGGGGGVVGTGIDSICGPRCNEFMLTIDNGVLVSFPVEDVDDRSSHLHSRQQAWFDFLGSMTEQATEIVSQKPVHFWILEISSHPCR